MLRFTIITMVFNALFLLLVGSWIVNCLDFPCNIQYLDFDELQTISRYEHFPSVPVIYKGSPNRQQAMSTLGSFDHLHNTHGDTIVQLSSSNTYSHGRHFMALSQYLDYIRGNYSLHTQANETLYLFGNNYQGVFQMLSDEYIIPPCQFCENAGATVVGIGGTNSGVSFHFHGPGFSESVIGSKRWFLYPPSLTKAVEKFGANTTVAKWVEHYYPLLQSFLLEKNNSSGNFQGVPDGFILEEWEKLALELHECTIYPGEALYFPNQWMHATLNVNEYNMFVSVFIDPQLIR